MIQDITSTCPQYKEEDEAARKERMDAYIELLTHEAIRKKNGGHWWLGELRTQKAALGFLLWRLMREEELTSQPCTPTHAEDPALRNNVMLDDFGLSGFVEGSCHYLSE